MNVVLLDHRISTTGSGTSGTKDPGCKVLPMHSGPQRKIHFRSLQTRTEDADEESPEIAVQEQVPELSGKQAEI